MMGENEQGHRRTSDGSVGQHGDRVAAKFKQPWGETFICYLEGVGIILTFPYLPLIPIAFFWVCIRKLKAEHFTIMFYRGGRVKYRYSAALYVWVFFHRLNSVD